MTSSTFEAVLTDSKTDKCTVSIYMGEFSEFGGSYVMEPDVFTNVFNRFRKKFPKYKNQTLRVYQYQDMDLIVDNEDNRTYQISRIVDTKMTSDMCVVARKNTSIYPENFPLLNRYHNLVVKNVQIFYWSPITVRFVTESTGEQYIELSFTNHCDKARWILSKLEHVLDFIQ